MSGLITISQKSEIVKIPNQLPIYIFSGGQDPVGLQGKGVLALKQNIVNSGCEQVQYKLYPGGRHEMLNEANANEVFNDVTGWVTSTIV